MLCWLVAAPALAQSAIWPGATLGADDEARNAIRPVPDNHVQYAGRLPQERLLELVRSSEGKSGRNAEYVINTASHLAALGIRDPVLEWLAAELKKS